MNSEQIKTLRTTGNFQGAIEQGMPYIHDFKILIQLNWAYYGLIKQQVAQIIATLKHSSQPPLNLINTVYDSARQYAKLPNRKADSSLSNILRELGKIAAYSPDYLKFIYWVLRINGLQDSDWEATEYQGKLYSPLVCIMARNLAKWAHNFPSRANPNDLEHIIGWLENTRSVAVGDDKLWLDWDRVKLLKKVNRQVEATKVLGAVLKAKRNEFWVWQEAGRLYTYEQPDLALACYCQALVCSARPEFTVNVHMELAQLLAQKDQKAWANAEIQIVLDIRQQQNWKIGDDLQSIMEESWYDPTISLPDVHTLYKQHAQEASILCFDDVYEQPATFAEIFELPPKKDQPKSKKMGKFIINQNNKPISIITPNIQFISNLNLQKGDAVFITIGISENNPATILHVSNRKDGILWDCAKYVNGVIESMDEKYIRVFIDSNTRKTIPVANWPDKLPIVGDGVVAFSALNPKKNSNELFCIKQSKLKKTPNISTFSGKIHRHEKGFAFLNDAFIPPNVLATIPETTESVESIAVLDKHHKKPELLTWRIISLSENISDSTSV